MWSIRSVEQLPMARESAARFGGNQDVPVGGGTKAGWHRRGDGRPWGRERVVLRALGWLGVVGGGEAPGGRGGGGVRVTQGGRWRVRGKCGTRRGQCARGTGGAR